MEKEKARVKVIDRTVHLIEPMIIKKPDGNIGYIKTICGEMIVREYEGKCYINASQITRNDQGVIYFPIKEQFDDL